MQIKYHSFPEEWGHFINCTKPAREVKPEHITILEDLRGDFSDRDGEILSYKFDIAPWSKEKYGKKIVYELDVLWRAGFILKFCDSFHTQSGNPNYNSWYIWSDYGEDSDTGWGHPKTAFHLSQG